MKNRLVFAGLIALVLIGVGVALWMVGAPAEDSSGSADGSADSEVGETPGGEAADGSDAAEEGEPGDSAEARRRRRRARKWVHTGDGSLVGTLREYGTDRPVAGVRVTLVSGHDGPNRTLAAIADETGAFVFRDVPAFDAWTLVAEAPEPLATAEVAGVAVSADQQADLGVVYLAPGFLVEGEVVDPGGKPIAGALVRAVRGSTGPKSIDILKLVREIPNRLVAVDSAETDDQGAFALSKVAPGTYDMYVSAPGRQLRVSRGVLVTPDRKGGALRFVLRQGFAISGRIIRETDGGPAGLTVVSFPNPNESAGFETLSEKTFAVADDQGRFELDGLRAGKYIVTVTPENAPTTIVDDVEVPGSTSVEIRIEGGAWLEGRIRDDEQMPVDGAEVMLMLDGAGDAPVFATTRTDAEGRYRLDSVPVIRVQAFMVRAEGYAPYPDDPTVLFGGGDKDRLELVEGRNQKDVELVAGGSVRGTVVSEGNSKPLAGVRVSLVSRMAMFGGANATTTGPQGTFELVGVPRGPAVLALWKEGWNQDLDMVTAMSGMSPFGGASEADPGQGPTIVIKEPGQIIQRTLTLARGVEVTGRVLSPEGDPVAGAKIEFGSAGGGRQEMAMMGLLLGSVEPRLTDADGHFTLPGARPGAPNVVQVTANGYRVTRSAPVMVEAAKAVPPIVITLGVGAT